MLKGVGSGYVGEAWGREVEGVILMSLRYDSIAFYKGFQHTFSKIYS